MKARILAFMVAIAVAMGMYGQTSSQHFNYEKIKGGHTLILPKGEVNQVLTKGGAILEGGNERFWKIWREAQVKPFQELIDSGFFSSERMRQLAKEDHTKIELTFDETGVVSYVSFFVGNGEKTILTDEELYRISQKYKTVVYDMTCTSVAKSATGSKVRFYCQEFFGIPFKDLKY